MVYNIESLSQVNTDDAGGFPTVQVQKFIVQFDQGCGSRIKGSEAGHGFRISSGCLKEHDTDAGTQNVREFCS